MGLIWPAIKSQRISPHIKRRAWPNQCCFGQKRRRYVVSGSTDTKSTRLPNGPRIFASERLMSYTLASRYRNVTWSRVSRQSLGRTSLSASINRGEDHEWIPSVRRDAAELRCTRPFSLVSSDDVKARLYRSIVADAGRTGKPAVCALACVTGLYYLI